MFKKINKKGFTLAELLIVVAIIGVLVAISIPIFTAQLRKARLATTQANARAAYAATVATQLQEGYAGISATYSVAKAHLGSKDYSSKDATFTTTGNANFDSWSVDAAIPGKTSQKFGDKQVTSWKVSIDKDGNVNLSATATK